jgi:hypothetical protein
MDGLVVAATPAAVHDNAQRRSNTCFAAENHENDWSVQTAPGPRASPQI